MKVMRPQQVVLKLVSLKGQPSLGRHHPALSAGPGLWVSGVRRKPNAQVR
jgi:hypothetical protein